MANWEKLQEVLKLARQTGDKVIVLDQENEPFVIMDLPNYRALLREETMVKGLSEEDLLDKINRQIAEWKASQPDLSDYDLSQFRVDSLRKPQENEPEFMPITNNRANRNDELLQKVIDNVSPDELAEQDTYYPEPES